MAPPEDLAARVPAGWSPAAVRGREGFFRAGRDAAGRWWLLDPAGEPIFTRAVHGVRPLAPLPDGGTARDAAAQLRAWGFNARGVSPGGPDEDGLPFVGAVDFCANGPRLVAPGLRLPDVFDSNWPAWAEARARAQCGPHSEDRGLIGWVSDEDLLWAQRSPRGRPTLLQLCLSLEPSCAAFHAAWEFVLALNGGRLDTLARNWGVKLANQEGVRELTRREEGIATRGYLRDQARWTREFSRRYFTLTAAAIRAADANHLVLGCRFRRAEGADVLAWCTYPAVDVAMPDWRELPAADAAGTVQPVWAGEVSWVDEAFQRAPAGGRGGHLTSVELMLRRARVALERLARHPAVVGYVWAQWQDEPGEQPPFARGLLHLNGVEAREHLELLSAFNLRAESLRRNPPPLSSA